MTDNKPKLEAIVKSAKKNRKEPWLGNPMKPIPITQDLPRDTRESTYIEETLSRFIGEYSLRGGMSRSHAVRRLIILGAMSEGYEFEGELEPVEA